MSCDETAAASEGSPSAATAPRRDGVWTVVLLALATLTLLWIHGYQYGDSNQTVQVPLVKSYIDRGLYGGDPLLWTRASYATVVYPIVGWLLSGTSQVEPAFFALHAMTLFLALAAAFALARLLFTDAAAGVAAVFLCMAPVASLAAERGLTRRFAHTEIAFAVLLWALWFALRERERWAAFFVGLGLNLHASYALHVAGMLGLDGLIRRKTLGWRRALIALAILALVALPTLVWIARVSEPMTDEWLRLVRLRSSHHSFPFTFPRRDYGRFLLLLLGLGAVALRDRPRGELHRRVATFAAALVPLLVIGVVFAEYWPIKAVLQAQFFRSTRLLTFFVLLYASNFFVSTWRRGGVGRLAVLAGAAALILPQFDWLLLPSIALFLLIEPRPLSYPRTGAALAGMAAGAVWGGYRVPSPLVDPYTLSYLDAARDPLVVGWAIVLIVARLAEGRGPLVRRGLATLAVIFLLAYSSPRFYERLRADYRDDDFVRMQLWVRDNTPSDAVILTPTDQAGFRVFSERAIVGEWKDGTMQYFSAAFTREWDSRMQALDGERGFGGLTPAALEQLGARYGARYVVARADAKLPFPRLYRSGRWAIHRLGPGGTSP